MKVTQRQAFLKRNRLTVNNHSFAQAISDLAEFLYHPYKL